MQPGEPMRSVVSRKRSRRFKITACATVGRMNVFTPTQLEVRSQTILRRCESQYVNRTTSGGSATRLEKTQPSHADNNGRSSAEFVCTVSFTNVALQHFKSVESTAYAQAGQDTNRMNMFTPRKIGGAITTMCHLTTPTLRVAIMRQPQEKQSTHPLLRSSSHQLPESRP